MESLRVSRGIEIEVNDRGETINVDVDNLNFAKALKEIISIGEEESKRIGEVDVKDDIEGMKLTVEVMERMSAKFDETFGTEATRKVFGDGVLPSPLAFIEFFDKLEPIVRKNRTTREKWLNDRYKPRKGGR